MIGEIGREKIRQSKLGSNNPMYGKRTKGFTGGHHSEQSKIKISNHNKGKKHSEETINKMKKSHSKNGYKLPTLRGKDHPMYGWVGSKNPNWQGGLTDLGLLIRNLFEYKNWRYLVFTRDRFTCTICGTKESNTLQAHHKKPFYELYRQFLKEYSQFSSIEDKETLLRIAVGYKPFWNLDNGQTMCINCHKMTETYFKKPRGTHVK